jgi:peptide chain release factor subunit 1
MLHSIKTFATYRSLANSTSLVTMYIPCNTRVHDITKMINSEISKAPNIKSRQTRQDVQDALQSILTNIKGYNKFPPTGIALFAGNTTEGFINKVVEPTNPINRFFYRCDTKFYL